MLQRRCPLARERQLLQDPCLPAACAWQKGTHALAAYVALIGQVQLDQQVCAAR